MLPLQIIFVFLSFSPTLQEVNTDHIKEQTQEISLNIWYLFIYLHTWLSTRHFYFIWKRAPHFQQCFCSQFPTTCLPFYFYPQCLSLLAWALSFLEQFYKILVQILIRRRCLQHNIKFKT